MIAASMSKFFFAVLGLGIFWTSCKSSRTVRDEQPLYAISSEALWQALDSSRFRYNNFSGRADLDIEDRFGKSSAVGFIRMQRDSIIWISVRKAGIEGARILISPDSVHILDRGAKAYYLFAYADLRSQYQMDISFTALQDLIAGNAILRQELPWNSGTESGQFTLMGLEDQREYRFWQRPADLALSAQSIVDPISGLSMRMELDAYYSTATQSFAMHRELLISGQEQARIKVRFTKISTNDPSLSYSFSVSPSYEVIRGLR